jgi:nucleoid DNA-binding protein
MVDLQGTPWQTPEAFKPRKRIFSEFDASNLNPSADSPNTMANLTKRDIVVAISNETGLVQHQVFDVVQRTLDHITEALAKGMDVELRNFGVFQVRLSKARVGRNPNVPGSNFAIPPRATVKFKSGKIMRQRVLELSSTLKKAQPEPKKKDVVRKVATTKL